MHSYSRLDGRVSPPIDILMSAKPPLELLFHTRYANGMGVQLIRLFYFSQTIRSIAMMILLSSFQALSVAFFLTDVFSIAGAELSEDFCDRAAYGRPYYSECASLLYGDRSDHNRGIFSIDNEEHGFFLPYFASGAPFTINQWRHRVELPQIWENGTSSLFFFLLLLGNSSPAHKSYLAGCKIALLVESIPTGGFTTDSGTWAEIAIRGKGVLDHCLLLPRRQDQSGGAGHAGIRRKLNIVIFGPGSLFDRAITSGVGPTQPAGVDRNRTLILSSIKGRIGNLSRA